MAESAVLGYLKNREDIPISIRKMSHELNIKKRCIYSICCNDSSILKVHPSHCGSGRSHLSVFVHTNSNKWNVDKPLLE